jgi:hypothetical protein
VDQPRDISSLRVAATTYIRTHLPLIASKRERTTAESIFHKEGRTQKVDSTVNTLRHGFPAFLCSFPTMVEQGKKKGEKFPAFGPWRKGFKGSDAPLG